MLRTIGTGGKKKCPGVGRSRRTVVGAVRRARNSINFPPADESGVRIGESSARSSAARPWQTRTEVAGPGNVFYNRAPPREGFGFFAVVRRPPAAPLDGNNNGGTETGAVV